MNRSNGWSRGRLAVAVGVNSAGSIAVGAAMTYTGKAHSI